MITAFRKHPTDNDPILAVANDDKFFSPPLKNATQIADWVAKNHLNLPPEVKVGVLDLPNDDWNYLIGLILSNFHELKFTHDLGLDDRPRADHIISWKRAIKMINDPNSPQPYKEGRLWLLFRNLEQLKLGPDWKISVMQATFNQQIQNISEKIEAAEYDFPLTKKNYRKTLESIAKLKDGEEIIGPEALTLMEMMDFFRRVNNINRYNIDKQKNFIKDIINYYNCREKFCLEEPDEIVKLCLANSYKIEAEIQKNIDQGIPDDLTDTISGDSEDPALITQRKFTAAYLEYILHLGRSAPPFSWIKTLKEIID